MHLDYVKKNSVQPKSLLADKEQHVCIISTKSITPPFLLPQPLDVLSAVR